jgi:hypothetical protein
MPFVRFLNIGVRIGILNLLGRAIGTKKKWVFVVIFEMVRVGFLIYGDGSQASLFGDILFFEFKCVMWDVLGYGIEKGTLGSHMMTWVKNLGLYV